MDIPLDEVVYFDAIASSSTGAAADADSTPTFAVYEEATDTDIGVGGNFTKRTSLTGNYRGSFTASTANGFEVGKWYNVIGSATIGGVATKGVVMRFRIAAAEATVGKVPATIGSGDIASGGLNNVTAWTVDITGTLSGTVGGIAGTTQTLDALQTALNSTHGAGSWATATGFAVAGDAMTLTMGQTIADSQTAGTVGAALLGMEAQSVGKWTIVGTTLSLYRRDGTTLVRSFTLDSATAPTSRT